MTQVSTEIHPLLEPAEAFARGRRDPAWLMDLRQQGACDFARLGLPTTKHEEWRQTNVAALGKAAFSLPGDQAEVDASAFERFAIAGFDAHTLVFVDGRFSPRHSQVEALPRGVTVANLSGAIAERGDWLAGHLGRRARTQDEAFVALNQAYLADGALVHVGAGARVDKPVHLLFVSSDVEQPMMTHPRVLVVVEEGGQVDVVEHHVGLGENVYFTNAVSEFVLGERAEASHIFIERDSRQAYNVSTLQIHQQAQSRFVSHTVLLGGKLVRNNVNPTFVGEYAHSVLNGIYLPDGKRHMDNHMRVHHMAANCDSRQYYTGVLSERSSGAFIGRIVVDPGAQKTDAVQSSRGLLLSADAYLHTRPQLEIFADDVKCTHGATIGELDRAALFYLESRGIPLEVARGLLIYSFASEALDRIALPAVREELGRLLLRQLKLRQVEAIL